jgi:hypothetical protein
MRVSVLTLAVLFASAGCASSATPPATRAARNIITRAEIDVTPAHSAYELVSRLRPTWLRATAPGSISGGAIRSQVTLVYLDDIRLGGVEALRTIGTLPIRSIRFLDATEAGIVLRDIGTQPIAGAIVIRTRD